MKFGLIGKGLSHSYSKGFFEEFFSKNKIDAIYDNISLEDISEFEYKKDLYQGFNVTSPYKESIIPFLGSLSQEAKRIGAVNCIKNDNGTLKGYNTDYYGFMYSLKPLLLPEDQNALILGSGGASKAVSAVLSDLNIKHIIVSREGRKNILSYKELAREIVEQHSLIINTTPLGMYPNCENFPNIPYQFLGEKHLCFDLIYNPPETEFLRQSKAMGARTQNGLEMLHRQAIKSMEIFELNP